MSFSDKEKLLKMSRNIIMNKILSANVRFCSKYRRKFRDYCVYYWGIKSHGRQIATEHRLKPLLFSSLTWYHH